MIMFNFFFLRGCNACASDRIAKIGGARGDDLLDGAAGGALTPRGATVPRERRYRQLVARQRRPQENSWRFRVDLAMSAESALSTGQRELS